jgi:hypothetical protein
MKKKNSFERCRNLFPETATKLKKQELSSGTALHCITELIILLQQQIFRFSNFVFEEKIRGESSKKI